MGNKTLIFAGVIFVGGLIYFNGQVADACTHGNCVHGWSSKNTQAEQNNSRIWFIGFPLFIFLAYQFFNINVKKTSKPSSPRNKAAKYSTGITINLRDLVKQQWEKKYGLILNFNENSELSGAKKFAVDKRLSMKKLNLSADELEERIKKKIEIDKQEEVEAKEEAIREKEEPRIVENEYQELVSAIQHDPEKQRIKLKKFYVVEDIWTSDPEIFQGMLSDISGPRLKDHEYEVEPPLYYKKEVLEKYTNYNFKKLMLKKYNKGMKSLFHD